VPLQHPLTEPDLSNFTFPDPHDPARWAGLAEYLEKYKDYLGMQLTQAHTRCSIRGHVQLPHGSARV
jgi:hypothetical protein